MMKAISMILLALASILFPDFLWGEDVAKPETLYRENCAVCHGIGGGGDGPKSVELSPKPLNFKDTEKMKGIPDEQMKRSINDGKGLMPSYGTTLSKAEVVSLIEFIKNFSKK